MNRFKKENREKKVSIELSNKRIKKRKLRTFFKRNSFKNLNTEIKAYGYNYNLKSFLLQMLVYLVIIVGAGYLYLIKPVGLIILIITAILCFPIIVRAQFKHMYNNQRFENLINYIEKMIIFFKQDPKILKCVEKTRMYVDSTTEACLDHSLDILYNDMSDDRYEKSLKIVEDEYHSSRLVSLHRFMRTVEEKSSKEYRISLNNLDYDLKLWENRVYEYQRELKTKKAQVMVSLIASIILLAIFSIMWIEVDELTKIISNPVYQVGSTAFLMVILILFTIVQTKVNGQWLVEDYSNDVDYKTIRKMERIKNYNYKVELKKQVPKIALFLIASIYCAVVQQYTLAAVLSCLVGYLFYEPTQQQKARIKSVGKVISIEFPLWLRDVALNLNNYVVVRAIEHSNNFASEVLKPYLNQFMKEVEDDPTSIEPFTNFLSEYKIHDITTSMLALYSLQEVEQKETEQEVTDIIKRNQTMLSNAEKIRNQNALIGVLIVSFIPIVFTMFKIIVDMILMLIGIFSNMNIG